MSILSGGSVTAIGRTYPYSPAPPPITNGAPGYIRLDAWGAPPVIAGTVDPAPTVLELPHLRTQSPPQIGSTWILDVLAPENAPVFVSASLLPGAQTQTPFGVLGLDPPTSASLAVTSAQPSHDPIASVAWPVPNASILIGLPLWVQAIAVPQNLPPRLSNWLGAIVQ